MYRYLTNCTRSKSEHIESMIDRSTEVSADEFRSKVSEDDLKKRFPVYEEWDPKSDNLTLWNDYAVSFYKSRFRGMPCYYVYHSSIEHVFVPEGNIKIAQREPETLYHGSPVDFDKFDPNPPDRTTGNETASLGHWFTNDENAAKPFAERERYIQNKGWVTEKGSVRPFKVHLKNPKIYEKGDFSKERDALLAELNSLPKRVIPSFSTRDEILAYEGSELRREEIRHQLAALSEDPFEQMMADRDRFCEYISGTIGVRGYWKTRYINLNSNKANKLFKEWLMSQGYDGIIIKGTAYDANGGTIDQYIAFSPEQIVKASLSGWMREAQKSIELEDESNIPDSEDVENTAMVIAVTLLLDEFLPENVTAVKHLLTSLNGNRDGNTGRLIANMLASAQKDHVHKGENISEDILEKERQRALGRLVGLIDTTKTASLKRVTTDPTPSQVNSIVRQLISGVWRTGLLEDEWKYDPVQVKLIAENDDKLNELALTFGEDWYYKIMDKLQEELVRREEAIFKRKEKKISGDDLAHIRSEVKGKSWEQAKASIMDMLPAGKSLSDGPRIISDDDAELYWQRLYRTIYTSGYADLEQIRMSSPYFTNSDERYIKRLSELKYRGNEGSKSMDREDILEYCETQLFTSLFGYPAPGTNIPVSAPSDVEIVRGVSRADAKLRPGEFVTTNRANARGYMRGKNGKIIRETVKTDDLIIMKIDDFYNPEFI